MKEYIDKKVAIVVSNKEEAIEINKLIVENGGRDLSDKYEKGEHYFGLEYVTRKQNCHTNSDFYIKKPGEYLIISASTILLGNNYQIF